MENSQKNIAETKKQARNKVKNPLKEGGPKPHYRKNGATK